MSLVTRSSVGALVTLSGVWVAACADSPAEMETPAGANAEAASLEIVTGGEQSGFVGQAAPVAPSVVVRNRAGRGLAGVTVRFSVVAGGGSVAVAAAETDAQGIAAAGRWTLGPVPGLNQVDAAAVDLPTVRFTAQAESPYSITVRYVGTATPRQQQAVDGAVARWRSIVLSELDDVLINSPARGCFASQPAIAETVDDLLLFVEFSSIDGVGSVLGQAGPCYIRHENSLPVVGYLNLDAADLVQIEARGALDDLVLHEVGHVLGIGTLWTDLGLINGAGSADPQFTGAAAVSAYRPIDAAAISVPVENTGSRGTRDGHWRETVFGNELMTGYLSSVPNPLSSITIGSVRDLGYSTSGLSADPWPSTAAALSTRPAIDLHAGEVILLPRYRVNAFGLRIEIGS